MTPPIQSTFARYELLFATLLVQVAVVAMSASLLLRFRRFTRLILAASPDSRRRAEFGIVLGVIAAAGASTRLSLGYVGADVTVILAQVGGLVMGWEAGLCAGTAGGLMSLRNGEWLAMPAAAAVGVVAGLSRRLLSDPDLIWTFSPVPFGNVIHGWRRWRREGVLEPRLLVLATGAIMTVAHIELARFTGERWLFALAPDDPISYYAVVLASLTCIGVTLRIWSTPRIEARLRRQEALLAEARLAALRGQINPHFLFNTLNTVTSLVRTHPQRARAVIVKLSTILRRLLYARDDVTTLSEELEFIDDYLEIEQARFGEDRLLIVKDVDERALSAEVPAMIMQPLVENAIKHGIAPSVLTGVITIAAHIDGDMLELEVRDNGVGMSERATRDSVRRGIGLSNVGERLRSLYGSSHSMELESTPGSGTQVCIRIPARAGEETPGSA